MNTGKTNTDWLSTDAQFIVFSNRCMHLGCPVLGTGVGFRAPATAAQYDTEGKRIAGPPIRPLDRFQWEIKNSDELWITQRWSVDFVTRQADLLPGEDARPARAHPGAVRGHRAGRALPERDLHPRRRAQGAVADAASRSPDPRAQALVLATEDWVEYRTGYPTLVRKFLFRKVPHTGWFHTLGSSLLTVFILQATTGILLAMSYDPSPAGAYESIRYITDDQTSAG